MKNLTLYCQEIRELTVRDIYSSSLECNHAFCINLDDDDFYIGTESNFYRIPSDNKQSDHVINFDNCSRIIGMFTYTERIYFASDSGEMFCFDPLDPENLIFYEQLNVDLQCMSVSPDVDIIVVVSTEGQIIILDLSLEVLSKVKK